MVNGFVVSTMDRARRLALIEENEAAIATTLNDQAMRKYARHQNELNGIVEDDYVPQPSQRQLVFKTHSGDTNLIAPVVTRKVDAEDVLMTLADEVGTVTGMLERELKLLQKRVEELEAKR